MTTAGRTDNGGTGITVTIIQSGREYLGSIPNTWHSSSEILLKISCTLSAVKTIFFSWESSFVSFHSAINSRPVLLIFGWYLPHPPCPYKKKKTFYCTPMQHNEYILNFPSTEILKEKF